MNPALAWSVALMADDLPTCQQLYPTRPAQDINGRTALHDAAHFGASICLAWLLGQSTALINTTDGMGETPLHRAAYGGTPECVCLLVDAGANPNALTIFNCSVLHYATSHPRPHSAAVVAALLRAGAPSETLNDKDETARQWASKWGIAWPTAA